jgi:hypothetical protein
LSRVSRMAASTSRFRRSVGSTTDPISPPHLAGLRPASSSHESPESPLSKANRVWADRWALCLQRQARWVSIRPIAKI